MKKCQIMKHFVGSGQMQDQLTFFVTTLVVKISLRALKIYTS